MESVFFDLVIPKFRSRHRGLSPTNFHPLIQIHFQMHQTSRALRRKYFVFFKLEHFFGGFFFVPLPVFWVFWQHSLGFHQDSTPHRILKCFYHSVCQRRRAPYALTFCRFLRWILRIALSTGLFALSGFQIILIFAIAPTHQRSLDKTAHKSPCHASLFRLIYDLTCRD